MTTAHAGFSAQSALRDGAGLPLRIERVRPDDNALAALAVAALIDEAELTPKPALVDRRGSGAHRDLDLSIMRRSAHALRPTFAALAHAARDARPSANLRATLARIGRAGEAAMMQATGGSNAHRGAIWIVGMLVAGAAMQDSCDDDGLGAGKRIATRAAQTACFPDHAAPSQLHVGMAETLSHGERVRQRFQVGGARHQAQAGFPHVIDIGLPALRDARARGLNEDAARIDTLLAIMATLDDTCLLHRAGLDGLHTARRGAQAVLDAGGFATTPGRAAFATLDRALVALNASPGGSADLLAATLFLDSLAPRAHGRSIPQWNI